MFQTKCFIAFITLFFITGIVTAVYAQDPVEVRKIEYLITRLETMKDVIFIRNGTEYNAKEATEHLRMKWKRGGNRIKTVDDFIELCASRSYITGQPYKIRFPNGRTEDAAVVLRKLLKDRSDQRKF
jgi:hypothetical protein